jgi:hypothetical protein
MGAYDPAYVASCSSDTSSATCSIFASGLSSDGLNYFNGVCTIRPLDSFPPYAVAPDFGGGSIVFDALFPAALSNNPASFDLHAAWIWVHNGRPPGETLWSTINLGVKFFTPDGLSQIYVSGGAAWSATPFASESPHRLANDPSTVVATTAVPIRVRVYADSNFHDPESNAYSLEWGATIWTDAWCLVPVPSVAIPSRLATIVG